MPNFPTEYAQFYSNGTDDKFFKNVDLATTNDSTAINLGHINNDYYVYQNTTVPNVQPFVTNTNFVYESEEQKLKKENEKIKKNMNYLIKFLIMKGIIKDEEEFKEFIEAMELAETLSKKEEPKKEEYIEELLKQLYSTYNVTLKNNNVNPYYPSIKLNSGY